MVATVAVSCSVLARSEDIVRFHATLSYSYTYQTNSVGDTTSSLSHATYHMRLTDGLAVCWPARRSVRFSHLFVDDKSAALRCARRAVDRTLRVGRFAALGCQSLNV